MEPTEDEIEKKKRERAERFGLKDEPNMSDEAEMKRKRMERFGSV